MTTRYQVWSTHVGEDKEAPARDVLEVSRTERKVADEDAALFRDLFHRKAWVFDTQDGAK